MTPVKLNQRFDVHLILKQTMAQAKAYKAFTSTETFTSPTGWLIQTSLSLKEGATQVKQSTHFVKESSLKDRQDIKDGLESGELTIVS